MQHTIIVSRKEAVRVGNCHMGVSEVSSTCSP